MRFAKEPQERPRVVQWLGRSLALGLFASLILFTWPCLLISASAFTGLLPPDPELWWSYGIAALPLAVAAVLWRRRSRFAPAWFLIGFGAFFATLVDVAASAIWSPFDAILGGDEPSFWERTLYSSGIDVPQTMVFLGCLSLWCLLATLLLYDPTARGWFQAAPPSDSGYASSLWLDGRLNRRPLVGTLALATVLFALWGSLGVALWPYQEAIRSVIDSPLSSPSLINAGVWTRFTIATLFLLWRLTERVAISDEGIRLFLFRPKWTLWLAPWQPIKLIEFMRHGRQRVSATVHYRCRFRARISFGLNFGRYERSAEVCGRLEGAAIETGTPLAEMRSAVWIRPLAWIIVLSGLGLSWIERLVSERLMLSCTVEPFPVQDFASISGLIPLTALYVGSLLVTGLGIGMLTGHDRGRPQLLMLALWLGASRSIYDPVLHWLVYIAIYAILSARIGTLIVQPHVPIAPYWQWDLALTVLQWAPVAALIGYLVGVPIARRRVNAIREE